MQPHHFCGVFHFNQACLARVDDTACMMADGSNIRHWAEGPIALAAFGQSNPLTVNNQRLIETDLTLVGHFRLDNRAALCAELKRSQSLSDIQLVAEAWRRWGMDAAQKLYGDWACAIWDRRAQTLWLGRDAAGNTGLYFWHNHQQLVFASSINHLLQHPAVPRQPNAYAVARLLTVLKDPDERHATVYHDIQRLAGGYALQANLQSVQVYGWWQPENLSEMSWRSDQDCYDAFRALYTDAVKERLGNNSTALLLNSGLDSGSVAALAGAALGKRGERLRAYISTPAFAPDGASQCRLGDESHLAKEIAAHIGHIDLIQVRSEQVSIVDSLDAMIAIHGVPSHAAANHFWMLECFRQAQSDGVGVMLTGQGGNATVSWNGTGNLWPALRSAQGGTLSALWPNSTRDLYRGFKRQLAKPFVYQIKNHWQRLQLGYRGTPPWTNYSAINTALVDDVQLTAHLRRLALKGEFFTPTQARDPRFSAFRLGRLGSASLGSIYMDLGESYGMAISDPTNDRRLIEFCWQVPDHLFWAKGTQRGLLRRGMPDCLPHAILHAQKKGLQAADIGYRVLAQRDEINAALQKIAGHPLAREWLDIPKMRAVIAELERKVTPQSTQQVTTILLRGLAVGLFLTRF